MPEDTLKAAGSFWESIPTILGFGFIGLSFLMLFMGFMALRQVTSNENPAPGSLSLCRTYLFISLAFLVLAGPLHIGLIAAERYFTRSVQLHFTMPTEQWRDDFGKIIVVNHVKRHALSSKRPVSDQVQHDAVISLDVESVVNSFRESNDTLKETTQKLLAEVQSLNETEQELSQCRFEIADLNARIEQPVVVQPVETPIEGPETAETAPDPVPPTISLQEIAPTMDTLIHEGG